MTDPSHISIEDASQKIEAVGGKILGTNTATGQEAIFCYGDGAAITRISQEFSDLGWIVAPDNSGDYAGLALYRSPPSDDDKRNASTSFKGLINRDYLVRRGGFTKRSQQYLAFALICAALCLYFVVSFFHTAQIMIEGAHWKPAPATITQSVVFTKYHSGRRGGFARITYVPQVSYRFTANGKDQFGFTLAIPKPIYLTLGLAQQAIAPYTVNSNVTIYYDPSDVDQSAVLRPQWDYNYAAAQETLLLTATALTIFFLYKTFKLRSSEQ